MSTSVTPSDKGSSLFAAVRALLSGDFLEKYGIYVALVVLFIIASIASPVFLRPANLINLVRQASALGIMAVGQTFVMLIGGIDLSVASLAATTNVVAATMMDGRNEMVLPVVLVTLGIAVLVGLVNGYLITKRGIPPFIMTLGMLILLQGARFVYSGGVPRGSIPDGLRFIGIGAVMGIPSPVILLAIIAGLGAVVLNRTSFGRRVYAVGGNKRATRLSGIRVDLVTIGAYVICSVLAAVSGLVLTGYIGLTDIWVARGYDLDSVAVAVVGGTALEGGRGGIGGTIAGVLILAILFNLVNLLNLNVESQLVIKGLVIIAAVALYSRRKLS
jgi:ribose transport system permease protein/inositol transport system permease protein